MIFLNKNSQDYFLTQRQNTKKIIIYFDVINLNKKLHN